MKWKTRATSLRGRRAGADTSLQMQMTGRSSARGAPVPLRPRRPDPESRKGEAPPRRGEAPPRTGVLRAGVVGAARPSSSLSDATPASPPMVPPCPCRPPSLRTRESSAATAPWHSPPSTPSTSSTMTLQQGGALGDGHRAHASAQAVGLGQVRLSVSHHTGLLSAVTDRLDAASAMRVARADPVRSSEALTSTTR